MIEQHNNSVIFRDVDNNDNLIDFSYLGMNGVQDSNITITEIDNGFLLGDALYYDYKTNHYRRALAVNQIMSEVIGVVSKLIDKDTFELTLKGSIILDRYNNIPEGTPLYLSQNISGKLVQDEPSLVSKIIGVTVKKGIRVDIQRGYYISTGPKIRIITRNNLVFNAKNELFYARYVNNKSNGEIKTNDDFIFNAKDGPFYYYNEYDNNVYEDLRYYTSQEIQDIITRIKNDIY